MIETNNNSIPPQILLKEVMERNDKNIEILFERPKSLQGTEGSSRETGKSYEIKEDKFKNIADVKSKSSIILTAENIDLKLGSLIPKMVKTVESIRYVIAKYVCVLILISI